MAKQARPSSQTRFQAWLINYLESTNQTNCDFADRVEINDSLVGHYIRGTRHPTYRTLQKIRRALRLDMNILFD